ncbi:DUF5672 family protein [Butyrivibrio sp. INlla16]|uniref:DUF5672 family protein n=1 Tax=Butyrivibrio sp. INlla16 TaxID=1520807 RepID=UPI000885F40E|nr:DUF5672 family protein [Butyrivibrio sp. INlla16]SDB35903.1 hypothetical protein SAMN02910263_01727 [Butyrivibrio sp. INlla16]
MNNTKKLQLPRVTIAAMTSVDVYETVQAMKYSMRDIEFGDAVLITDKKPFYLPKDIRFSYTSKLDDIDKFNYKMVYELRDHIKTDFVLIVHADGFVIHPENWDESFLNYDYIGSPWPLPKNDYAYRDSEGNICRVGNSVSIRSKRLLDYPKEHDLPWVKVYDGFYNEDIFLCCHCKNEMEKDGLKWADLETAVKFGREHPLPENKGVEPFVFHKWWGENEGYPHFYSPAKRFKMAVRPLLFWRRSEKWKREHNIT